MTSCQATLTSQPITHNGCRTETAESCGDFDIIWNDKQVDRILVALHDSAETWGNTTLKVDTAYLTALPATVLDGIKVEISLHANEGATMANARDYIKEHTPELAYIGVFGSIFIASAFSLYLWITRNVSDPYLSLMGMVTSGSLCLTALLAIRRSDGE